MCYTWAIAQQFDGRKIAQRNGDASNLKLKLLENDSLRASVAEKVTGSNLEQWFDVEKNDHVREASISRIADDMEQLVTATPARDIE